MEPSLLLNAARANWMTVLRSRWFLCAMIPLLWALAYLPAIGARDLRLEEGRRATPAMEMLRSGDFVTPTLYGEPYLSKPPLFFWIVAGMGKAQSGVNELSVRIPSVLSVLLGAYLLAGFAPTVLRREVRVLAALVFMSMPIMLDKGRLGEIDAVLSLITFAAIAWWWRLYDAERGRVGVFGWIGAGLLLGLSILMKGPGGIAEFYAVILGFAIAGRRWKVLLSPWHLLMLVIAIVPVALWVWALLGNTVMEWKDLAKIWMQQTGADVVAGGASKKEWGKLLTNHYLPFPLRAISDLAPWIFAGFLGWWATRTPSVSEGSKHGPSPAARDLWRMLAASWPTLLAIFWLWPKGSPRYMMMGAYPVSLLVAWIIVERWDVSRNAKLSGALRSAGTVMAWAMGLIGGASIMLAVQFDTNRVGSTILIVLVSLVIAVWAMWLTRRSPIEHAGIACACNLAILMLLGWGMLNSVLLPVKAKDDPTRILHHQIQQIVPRGLPIYTTLTFRSGREAYFNMQFYLPGDVKTFSDFSKLPPGQKAIVIIQPNELTDTDSVLAETGSLRELGRLNARKPGSPPEAVVAEVVRK